MKMVKSLLLGTAAGLVAMTGAQAADLPVKAKPVQYVKICSLYGAGFYYIPGTDMCLKIGGWARLQTHWNVNGNSTNGPLVGNNTGRQESPFTFRSRGYITADARNQTEYGTLRSYIAVGFSTDLAATTASGGAASVTGFDSNRAFIQLAGFTFGKTKSFYDFYDQPAQQYFGYGGASDTGDGGKVVFTYTAQLGNGLSASFGFEDPRRSAVLNSAAGASTILAGALPATAGTQIGERYPDIVANLRVDQAWGAAQIMGALHDASGGYYTATNQGAGHTSDKMGWAVGAGLRLNAPMLGAGDWFQFQINYTQGAAKYVANTGAGTAYSYMKGGGSYGYGVYSDATYSTVAGSPLELTTVWGLNAGYDHYWNKSWQTSIWTAYNATSYTANGNANLCSALATTTFTTAITPAAGCNNNFQHLAIGTRTQWNVDATTYIGLELVYSKLYTASQGVTAAVAANGSQPAAARLLENQDAYSLRLQIHRNFYP